MTRRIVQIAATDISLFAFSDDGSVWQWAGHTWFPVEGIPQDTPAESPDPIAEIEAMGGRLLLGTDDEMDQVLYWMLVDDRGRPIGTEPISGSPITVESLRAAAARLLERVRGAK